MEASSVGKREYGVQEDESITGCIWAAGFHHVTARSHFVMACSHFACVLKLMNHLGL
jgi:hypothetical protein